MAQSAIGWADYSGGDLNFVWRGRELGECECSPGCRNCYARWMMSVRDGGSLYGPVTTYHPDKLAALGRWRPRRPVSKRGPGGRPLGFVCDTGELSHPRVPETFIQVVLETLATNTALDWMVLVKRVERLADLWAGVRPWPHHVWVGATCEDQHAADARIPHLLRIPAAVRVVCVEPMLGPVRLALDGIGWVICGGESGDGRRPFYKSWALDLYDQCRAARVPFFFKQGSARQQGNDCILSGLGEVKQWPVSDFAELWRRSWPD